MTRQLKILIACEDEAVAGIRKVVEQGGYTSQPLVESSRDMLVSRTAQFRPDVVIFAVPDDARHESQMLLRELGEVHSAHIIAIGRTVDAKLILQMLHAGAKQYIDEANYESELIAELRRFRSGDFLPAAHQGRVISILGTAGGCGASTVAVNIAASLAKSYSSCGLVDMRLAAGDLPAMLDLNPDHSVADFCANLKRMDVGMFRSCLARHESGIHLMAAPVSRHDARQITADGLRRMLSLLRSNFPYVVVDMDASYRSENEQILFQSDTVVLITRLDFAALSRTRNVLRYLEELKMDPTRLRLVINHYRRGGDLKPVDMERSLGLKVSAMIPYEPSRVIRANNQGIPVVLGTPRAGVSRSLVDIAISVNGKLESS